MPEAIGSDAAGVRAHVGLNAQLLAPPGTYRGAGISGYIAGLISHLPHSAPDLRFTAWLPQRREGWAGLEQRESGLSGDRVMARVLWEQGRLPVEAMRLGVDLLHGLAFALPMLSPIPAVVTVPDMSYLLFPHYHARGRRLYLNLATRLAVAKARAVVAISECTKRDVCRLLGVSEAKVAVTHLGVDEQFAPPLPEERAAFLEKVGLKHYIYYQGTLEPRKHLLTLVEAFALLRRSGWREHKLVLGGAPGWGYQRIYEAVEREGLAEDVVFLGYVPPEESPRWYGGADLFVYPSAYEGFGLPPLEAMACGTPVVTSDASSLPEVVGNAGLMVRPGDARALMEAMLRLLSDPALRSELSAKGLARARRFSWTATAKATSDLYARCLA